ncbi:hypothetical protein BUALT_Bualt02G0020000 [Buddleja alternifolia]|uniref:Coiled-coil domain-containing protein R3HCC1L n=1 Tax=Buddleja alternifolia TaxID=168488 RepID=A0AAV6Y3V1_9LAMI|nr:hypothetical protein BUALT_Bualt02G0020000 [Buddleja alternifolia]
MSSSGGATACNWTETVEDLVDGGEIDQAISYLESTITNLEKEIIVENEEHVNDQLSTALQDLSKLYSTKGLSLRADESLSRALQLKNRRLPIAKGSISDGPSDACVSENEATTSGGIAEDDWETIADCAPEELLSPQSLPGVSKLSLEDPKEAQGTKRRGRGTFSYKKQGLHSDNQSDEPLSDDSDNNSHAEAPEKCNLTYGTRHALVLANFPPSTRTTDLEKVLEKFKDCFVIRWVNDTMALAVFRTPSIALEASNSIQCPFKVYILDEGDELLSSIPPKDLEPPRQRPQTSARTAQRLIAQGMGIKLPSTFGSTELRKQEEARRNRIVSRQNMKDDAWGDDDDAK